MKDVIIIPTYNERENIETLVTEIFQIFPHVYIVVADDSSPDKTGEVVTRLTSEYPNLSLVSRAEKNGLGRAYLNAFSHVLADPTVRTVTMMDADLSHQPKYLPEMFERSTEYTVVMGSRYVPGGKTIGWELWRRVLSFGANLYCRLVTYIPIHDCTGGFNIISADLLRKIDFSNMDMSGYAFIMELKYMLYLYGGTFCEVPITFVNRVGGESKMSGHIISEGVFAPWKMVNRNYSKKPVPNISCPLCTKTHIQFYTRKNGYDVYRCRFCKLLFVYPLPPTITVYNETYFSGATEGFGYVDYDTDKEPMTKIFEKYLDKLSHVGVTSGKFLDVGAATGFFMSIAKKRGYDVTGVEISDYASEKGREKGLQIYTGDLHSVAFQSDMFDVVSLCDVLEHVPSPTKFLEEVTRILKPGGYILINTPNAESIVAKILRTRWHLIVPPEHLHYFSPRNLSQYLLKQSFAIKNVSTIGKRFTLEYIFKTLYKWQSFVIWKWSEKIFSTYFLRKLYIPLNTHDNFFIIAQKSVVQDK